LNTRGGLDPGRHQGAPRAARRIGGGASADYAGGWAAADAAAADPQAVAGDAPGSVRLLRGGQSLLPDLGTNTACVDAEEEPVEYLERDNRWLSRDFAGKGQSLPKVPRLIVSEALSEICAIPCLGARLFAHEPSRLSGAVEEADAGCDESGDQHVTVPPNGQR